VNPIRTKLNVLSDPSAAELSRTESVHLQTHGPTRLDIEVISDVICPWCYVGKRRLEKAIHLLGPEAHVTVTWRPFQLNPTMPKAGMDRNEYRSAKFGSLERSHALDAKVAAVGAAEGIEFHFDSIHRTPNTLDAHRLIWLAQHQGRQDAVVEALFRAYFVDAVDVGEPRNLITIAAAVGMEKESVEQVLASDAGLEEMLAEERRFKGMRIDGVPGFFLNGRFLFSGAAEPQDLAEAFLGTASRL